MRQSKLLYKAVKDIPKGEVSLNAQLLIRASFVDKLMAGVYIILPLGLRVIKKIERIIREEMDEIGGQEILLPALHPRENWEKTGRWNTMEEDLFKLSNDNKESNLLLGPTHEEVVTPLMAQFIKSYKDLPLSVYQFQNKFRNEKRAKSGVLRGREFMMKDMYSFHSSEDDLGAYYDTSRIAYAKIFERCGIGEKTYLTYASGGSFSQYSHEFQTLTRAGEDLIYICDNCRIAINKEILSSQENRCPECGNGDLREEKSVEVGNIFKLKTKFSKPFELTFRDQDDTEKIVFMGCYGIGLQRLMGTIVELSNDERGIIWPKNVAPFHVHLITLAYSRDEESFKESERIYQILRKNSIDVLWDDRVGNSAGEKFAEADLIGCPYRLTVSKNTLREKKFEVKKRAARDVVFVDEKELLCLLKELN